MNYNFKLSYALEPSLSRMFEHINFLERYLRIFHTLLYYSKANL